MKKFWLILAVMIPMLAWGQLYNPTVESGDTLIAATVDTTDGCLIYNTSVDDRRPVRPTLFIDVDEIGTNTTHYWLEIAVDVASGARLPAKDADSWYPVYRRTYNDWLGFGAANQYNIPFALPQLETFGFSYFRVRLNYPFGLAADSTGYAIYLGADENNNMYQVPPVNFRRISHYELFGTSAAAALNGANATSSYAFDLLVEKTPGNFQVPTRMVVQAIGDATKCDADSILLEVYGYCGPRKTPGIICTDTIPTFSLSGYNLTAITLTTGFVNSVYINFTNLSPVAADTSNMYGEVILEGDP